MNFYGRFQCSRCFKVIGIVRLSDKFPGTVCRGELAGSSDEECLKRIREELERSEELARAHVCEAPP